MSTRLCPPAEFILGMQTFIIPCGSKAVVIQGTIHGTLLLGGKVVLSCRLCDIPVSSAAIEASLRAMAQEAADRLKREYNGKGTGELFNFDTDVYLKNGIRPDQVKFWELPANTAFEEHHLDFFRQSFRECFGVLVAEHSSMRAA